MEPSIMDLTAVIPSDINEQGLETVTYHSLSYGFRVSPYTISGILYETCEVIIAEHLKEVAVCPSTPDGWRKYNYKGFHSLVLFAVVDSDYKFLYPDVGTNGVTCDGKVFNLPQLKKTLEEIALCLLSREPIEDDDCLLPYIIIGKKPSPCPFDLDDEAIPTPRQPMDRLQNSRAQVAPNNIHKYLMAYYNSSVGSVRWHTG
ncbi:hypothetical protein O3P69_000384 [Scylla paramamosain]|uniref:Uncharacterized protein n=1 Tax=Scylla paramamosain TaxID=85552 RepID=A0AAW0UVF3_SCYPA